MAWGHANQRLFIASSNNIYVVKCTTFNKVPSLFSIAKKSVIKLIETNKCMLQLLQNVPSSLKNNLLNEVYRFTVDIKVILKV